MYVYYPLASQSMYVTSRGTWNKTLSELSVVFECLILHLKPLLQETISRY